MERNDKEYQIPLDSLVPLSWNPRQIRPAALEALKRSIEYGTRVMPEWKEEWGFRLNTTIVINRQGNRIIGGHQRVMALRSLGQKWVHQDDITWVDITPDSWEEKERNISLNNQIIGGEFTFGALALIDDIKVELPEIEVDALGLNALLNSLRQRGMGGVKKSHTKSVEIDIDSTELDDVLSKFSPTDEEKKEFVGRKILVEYSGGKDSTAAVVWCQKFFPDNEIELMFIDLGSDYPGYIPYVIESADYLGLSLKIVRSEKNMIVELYRQGKWPAFSHPYCHEVLHQALDSYTREHKSEEVIIVRGGRLSESSRRAKGASDRFLYVKRLDGYTFFQPFYFASKRVTGLVMKAAKINLWEGYKYGLQRTACRLCPGQTGQSYAALRYHFPDIWRELIHFERRFGSGCWHQEARFGGRNNFDDLANRGEGKFREGGFVEPKLDEVVVPSDLPHRWDVPDSKQGEEPSVGTETK